MNLGLSDHARPLHAAVARMVASDIAPLDAEFHAEVGRHPSGDRFQHTPRQRAILDDLKATAKSRGLWNFWRTNTPDGPGLTNVDYAYFAEEMGKVRLAAECFNCSAPDTGNMEVFDKMGTAAHKERWLAPLLNGEIRSAYLMTEPAVASSDATNIKVSAVRRGDHFILNGEKYWASGAGDPRCAVYIVLAETNAEAHKHARHSMFVLAAGTPGIEILRPMEIFGHDDAPHGHMHIRFTDVAVPAADLVLGEGRGFEVAQARLGPGRIHHCMRSIGLAEVALELFCRRGLGRTAFGKPLTDLGGNMDRIADARMAIEQARLLCLKAAHIMDTEGVRAAQPFISMIKVVAPEVALAICDEAIQLHGGTGVSQDTPLAAMWMHLRTMRLVDGPDAVHRRQIARRELKFHTPS
ncbi:MAG: acyl-CoA dehydrogenase family protein [Pseudomonadota bacterium]